MSTEPSAGALVVPVLSPALTSGALFENDENVQFAPVSSIEGSLERATVS